ncbi:MAG: tetratricopeptide repeat protein [Bacteroidales bacterium]|nr:tetratricopeptide repeat protein [Bacteroidales bacterium]
MEKIKIRDRIFVILLVFSQIACNSQNSKNFYEIANNCYQQGKYIEAIENYDKAIENDADFADAYYNRGSAKREIENFEGAINDFSRCIQLDATNYDAYNNRANCKMTLGQNKSALKDFNMAIELSPETPLLYFNRGNLLNETNDFESAVLDYNNAIELNPEFETAYFQRATALSKLNDYKAAIIDYSKAITFNENAEYFHNRGLCYYYLTKYDESINDLEQAIAINPDFAAAYYICALVQIEAKIEDNTCKYLYKALELGINEAEEFIQEYCE